MFTQILKAITRVRLHMFLCIGGLSVDNKEMFIDILYGWTDEQLTKYM